MKFVTQYTLAELADLIEAEVRGDGACLVSGLATIQDAQEGQLSFLANSAYIKYLAGTQASAVILSPEAAAEFSGNALVMKNPYLGFARASRLFEWKETVDGSIHASAVVDPSAVVAKTATIGANAVVEAGAVVGERAYVGAGSCVGCDSSVGADTILKANVTLCHGVTVGDRCILHAGAVVGSDGFGFANSAGEWVKIAQLGGVVIGNDVEIGAGTTIDRGALGDTVIHDGVKLDNLIQVAHNVSIGRNTAIAGCTGIAGSTTIGASCTIAGGVGIAGHLTIADNVHIAGMAMISRSITESGAWSSGTIGTMSPQEWRKNTVRFRQLDDMARRLRKLEKQLNS